jgi:putative ABC transport system permease protein
VKTIPPKFARWLLLKFLREDFAEEVEGDLEEKFYETLKTRSAFSAKLMYWYQVMNYLRPFAIRKKGIQNLTHYDMFSELLQDWLAEYY